MRHSSDSSSTNMLPFSTVPNNDDHPLHGFQSSSRSRDVENYHNLSNLSNSGSTYSALEQPQAASEALGGWLWAQGPLCGLTPSVSNTPCRDRVLENQTQGTALGFHPRIHSCRGSSPETTRSNVSHWQPSATTELHSSLTQHLAGSEAQSQPEAQRATPHVFPLPASSSSHSASGVRCQDRLAESFCSFPQLTDSDVFPLAGFNPPSPLSFSRDSFAPLMPADRFTQEKSEEGEQRQSEHKGQLGYDAPPGSPWPLWNQSPLLERQSGQYHCGQECPAQGQLPLGQSGRERDQLGGRISDSGAESHSMEQTTPLSSLQERMQATSIGAPTESSRQGPSAQQRHQQLKQPQRRRQEQQQQQQRQQQEEGEEEQGQKQQERQQQKQGQLHMPTESSCGIPVLAGGAPAASSASAAEGRTQTSSTPKDGPLSSTSPVAPAKNLPVMMAGGDGSATHTDRQLPPDVANLEASVTTASREGSASGHREAEAASLRQLLMRAEREPLRAAEERVRGQVMLQGRGAHGVTQLRVLL